MAKAKQKKIKVKHGARHVRNPHLGKALFLSALLLILIIIYFGISFLVKGQSGISAHKIQASIPLTKFAPKRMSLITPYPSITVTPTPAPLTGYCLRVPILTYHHIQPESAAKELGQTSLTVDNGIFDQQMAYLAANGYTPIWANELIDALRNHTGLPGKPIMVTMDDGYADNAIYALPVLQKYAIKANLMLASGLVGGNSDMLSWDQVSQMKGSGLVYFTNHTWSHYPIASGPQSKIEFEIDTAQSQIQDHTGQTVNIFTYPYGSFSNNAIQTLQRKGYLGAFSTIPGVYQCDSFIMTLHRYRIGNASLASYGI
jgi:peptidoglycan/xylan/chitin deacetylase (PgdA/CDA1 family)